MNAKYVTARKLSLALTLLLCTLLSPLSTLAASEDGANNNPIPTVSANAAIVKYVSENGFMGLISNTENVQPGVSFTLTPSTVAITTGDNDYTGDFTIGLFTAAGQLREVYVSSTIELPVNAMTPLTPWQLTTQLTPQEGDYFELLFTPQGSSEAACVCDVSGRHHRVLAKGYEIPRAKVAFSTQGEGVTVARTGAGDLNLDPARYGAFRFRVTYDSSVEVVSISTGYDGDAIYTEGTGTIDGKPFTNYCIPHLNRESYTITVRGYQADEIVKNLNIHLVQPGTLQAALEDYDLARVHGITVTGTIDSRDLRYLKNSTRLRAIDLGEAKIVANGSDAEDHIPAYLFQDHFQLELFVFPKGLKGIGQNAFQRTALTSVVIPAGVNLIDLNTFNGCYSLREVSAYNPTALHLCWCVFAGTSRENDGVLHLVPGTKAAYEAEYEWSLFTTIVEDLAPAATPATYPVTLTSTSNLGYAATFSAGEDVQLPEDITAYTATLTTEEGAAAIHLTPLGSDIVPAGTGVILLSPSLTTATLTATSAGSGDGEPLATSNLLRANLAGGLPLIDTDHAGYLLTKGNDGKAHFAPWDASDTKGLAANHAYLALATTSAPSPAEALSIAGDLVVSGICQTEIGADSATAPCYTLDGRRVAQPARGTLYLQNGRKLIAQ